MTQFQDLLASNIEFFPRKAVPEVSPFDIVTLEQMIEATLPTQYRDYLVHANGGGLDKHMSDAEYDDGYCAKVYWPKANKTFKDEEYVLFNNFFCTKHPEFHTETLQYNFNTWKERLPKHTLPIGRGPGGNYFLLGFGAENHGKIFYWRIVGVNLMESDENDDTVAKAYCGFIADSFVEFIQNMVLCETVEY